MSFCWHRSAEAEEMRYMTEERFSQIKKKMAQSEVRKLLGPVNYRNIKEYPEREVVAWFYQKPGTEGRRGHLLQGKGTRAQGDWQVYDFDFNAVKPEVVSSEGEWRIVDLFERGCLTRRRIFRRIRLRRRAPGDSGACLKHRRP